MAFRSEARRNMAAPPLEGDVIAGPIVVIKWVLKIVSSRAWIYSFALQPRVSGVEGWGHT